MKILLSPFCDVKTPLKTFLFSTFIFSITNSTAIQALSTKEAKFMEVAIKK